MDASSASTASHHSKSRSHALFDDAASSMDRCENNSLKAENCAACEGLMRQVEEGNRRNDSLEAKNCTAREGLMHQAEEVNHRNDSLNAENCAARKGLMRQVEEANRRNDGLRSSHAATVTRLEGSVSHLKEEVRSLEEAKAEATKVDVKVQHLSDEVRAAHAKCKENKGMLEEIIKENEQLELMADQKLDYIRTLAIERNQAKSELVSREA